MIEKTITVEKIEPLSFFGVNNARFEKIKKINPTLEIVSRGREIRISGKEEDVNRFTEFLTVLMGEIEKKGEVSDERLYEMVEKHGLHEPLKIQEDFTLLHGNGGTPIKPKTSGQREIVKASLKKDIIFAVGPAGTGKTFIAVALAVKAMKEKKIRKIYLVRPAVEAGENLGFLPGDLKEKVGPYLRPLYDALAEMLQFEKVQNYLEREVIEIVPMAYMRGRTLNNAFVILDEAQNATVPQFKMFLTRMGKGSKVFITGDPSQIDLPYAQKSGLLHALDILNGIPEIAVIRLKKTDVMRHPVVRKIIGAYEQDSKEKKVKEKSKEENGKK